MVRSDPVNVIYISPAMILAVNRRPVTAQTQVQSQASECGTVTNKLASGRVHFRVLRCSPVSIIKWQSSYKSYLLSEEENPLGSRGEWYKFYVFVSYIILII
jgi:hypothetical protein